MMNGRWIFSLDNPPNAALTWQYSRVDVPCTPLSRGKNFVAVEWEGVVVFSCYFSSSLLETDFQRGLFDLGAQYKIL